LVRRADVGHSARASRSTAESFEKGPWNSLGSGECGNNRRISYRFQHAINSEKHAGRIHCSRRLGISTVPKKNASTSGMPPNCQQPSCPNPSSPSLLLSRLLPGIQPCRVFPSSIKDPFEKPTDPVLLLLLLCRAFARRWTARRWTACCAGCWLLDGCRGGACS
jgi:hypothetical protein